MYLTDRYIRKYDELLRYIVNDLEISCSTNNIVN